MSQEDLQSAWSTCRAQRERWLIADPLAFAEFDVTQSVPNSGTDLHTIDADRLTRAKQSGGLRCEVFPDVFASTTLQLEFDLITASALASPSSLSLRLFGNQLKGENPYEVWSASVMGWVRGELAAGRTVVACDFEDYFSSVRTKDLDDALGDLGVHSARREVVIRLLESINHSASRPDWALRGLPVVPSDFFWLAADIVLLRFDREVQNDRRRNQLRSMGRRPLRRDQSE